MTTLCCYAEPGGRTWIASDRQITAGGTRESIDSLKWENPRDRIWIGYSGPVAVQRILAEVIRGGDENAPAGIAELARAELAKRGWDFRSEKGDAPYIANGIFLCAYGYLSELDLATGTAEPILDGCFRAYGTGRAFAQGAWQALSIAWQGIKPRDAITNCVRAAIDLDIYSGGDPWVMELERGAVSSSQAVDPGRSTDAA